MFFLLNTTISSVHKMTVWSFSSWFVRIFCFVIFVNFGYCNEFT